ncbi:MAG: hypothetical protein ABSF90_32470 [Syntrophobacteraceae bacterium]
MTEDKSGEDRTARLRRLAEERSRESAAETARTMAEQDYQVLVHELQVHQIELAGATRRIVGKIWGDLL